MKEKLCRECGTTFMPSGPAGLYCPPCAEDVRKRKGRETMQRLRRKKAEIEGRLDRIGIGKGGGQPKGKDSPTYKNGILFFQKEAPRIKEARRYCERCGKDLKEAGRYQWCVHHKDHDRSNNVPTNFELLCKRCHQIEHKCWEAFGSSTTMA